MKCLIICLALLLPHASAKTQVMRDSNLIFAILSADSVSNGYRYYTIRTCNYSDSPISILYSIRAYLSIVTETRLGIWENSDSSELYLGYSAGELVHLHWLPDEANNPFILLPRQVIDFSIAAPVSRKKQFLNFDYVIMPDLHYRQLLKAYLSGSAWNRPYKRVKKRMELKPIVNRLQ
jgi:hypothetical protein